MNLCGIKNIAAAVLLTLNTSVTPAENTLNIDTRTLRELAEVAKKLGGTPISMTEITPQSGDKIVTIKRDGEVFFEAIFPGGHGNPSRFAELAAVDGIKSHEINMILVS